MSNRSRFATIKYQYYIVYACTNAGIAACVYLFFPETLGRSLEEVDDIFAGAPGPWSIVSFAKRLPAPEAHHVSVGHRLESRERVKPSDDFVENAEVPR